MWSISEVKKQAWNGLKNYYWKAVLCGFLVGLLGILSILPYALAALLFAVCVCIAPLAPFASCIVDGIYSDILDIGKRNVYLRSIQDETSVPVSTIFSGFKSGFYKASAQTLIFRNVFLFLWSLLFFFPGIVKGYQYRMIPYLVAEYPEKGQDEVFDMSKEMMNGNKMKVFLFDLSFIGWILLALLPAGLGLPFFFPYYNAACTELYLTLKESCLGISRNSNSGNSHIVYQPENQKMLPPGNYMNDDDDAPTVDVNYGYDQPAASQAFGRPVLVGVQGEYAGATIPIEPGQKLIVGRDSSRCNVILASPQVSRLHMTVEYAGNKFIVVDYSSYGTFDVERGQLPKETSVTVAPGTTLRLGNGNDTFRLDLG
ncbi:MAG: DUF975 family protein [Lachnospiraceae bacterium]|nr:DUF975 family protein [Lachnospiraceae bacterium]